MNDIDIKIKGEKIKKKKRKREKLLMLTTVYRRGRKNGGLLEKENKK